MSRLSRAIVRRDKAYQLLGTVESEDQERQQLNHMDRLTAILRDIDPNKIGPIPKNFKKRNPVWETICVVAKIASITDIWTVASKDIQEYLPVGKHELFREKWNEIKANPAADALDFLNILKLNNVAYLQMC